MSTVRRVPLNPETFERMRALRERIEAGDVPPEIAHAKAEVEAAARRAEALFELSGQVVDEASIEEVVRRRRELDAAYMRAIGAL